MNVVIVCVCVWYCSLCNERLLVFKRKNEVKNCVKPKQLLRPLMVKANGELVSLVFVEHLLLCAVQKTSGVDFGELG